MGMTVAQALARGMKAFGAKYVFTLTGAPQDPLLEMQNREEIRVVLARSERSAFCMADAHARFPGKPAFGEVQFGPGATYLPPSLIDAFWAKSPLVAISASTSTRMKHLLDYEEADQLPMFQPFTARHTRRHIARRKGLDRRDASARAQKNEPVRVQRCDRATRDRTAMFCTIPGPFFVNFVVPPNSGFSPSW